MNTKQFWRVPYILYQFFLGDRSSGWIRLLFVGGIILICLKVNPRYLIVVSAALIAVLFTAARYVQDIYNLDYFGLGMHYVLASFFGLGYPVVVIDAGQMQLRPGEVNLLDKIGGPGYLIVEPGNAVLIERLDSPSDVHSAGRYFLPRFESVKEIIDLSEQQGNVEKVESTTKDGIVIEVSKIHYNYRLWAGKREKILSTNPFPYSVQSVRNMVYNRSVGAEGVTTPWRKTVEIVVKNEITDYIAENQADRVLAPRYSKEKDPRVVIKERITSPGNRSRLRNTGTELTWFDIGHFEPAKKEVGDERLKAWQAKWSGAAMITRAQGDAQRIAYQELGRMETQADLLHGIVAAIKDVQWSDDEQKENIRKIILARTAQILESMTSVYQTPDTDGARKQPTKGKGESEL